MFSELNNYQNNGHFFFIPGDSLAEVTKGVPDLPGVYYIIRLAHGNVELVYLGKSGSIEQDGNFKKHGLRGRLNNTQEGMLRQEFFDMKCLAENIDALDIYWSVIQSLSLSFASTPLPFRFHWHIFSSSKQHPLLHQ